MLDSEGLSYRPAANNHLDTGLVVTEVVGAISGSTGGSNPRDKKKGTRKRTGTSANKI
jgi:hypothetical protein